MKNIKIELTNDCIIPASDLTGVGEKRFTRLCLNRD